jgi:hypothetical protein
MTYTINQEFAKRIIAVINDLIDEATHKGVVQRWDEVNEVLIFLKKVSGEVGV